MKSEKTLRDELAMSMTNETLPTLESEDAMVKVAKKYNIEFDLEDEISLINFALKYRAAIRYEYADAMLAARKE